MKTDQRMRYLLRAASRAEVKGDLRTANNFRRMIEDSRPFDGRGRQATRPE